MADPPAPCTETERLHIALDLFDEGVEIMRMNLRRSHPGASEDELERLLIQWLHTRPGAEFGDAEGTPRA